MKKMRVRPALWLSRRSGTPGNAYLKTSVRILMIFL